MEFSAFPLLIILLFAGVIGLVFWLKHQRRKKLIAVAESLGLTFDPKDSEKLLRKHKRLAAFEVAGSQSVSNVFRGTYRGREVRVFDFDSRQQHGKNSTHFARGVALAYVPADWPDVSIVPENIGHKLLGLVGVEEIDFESDEFSRRFWVRAADRRFAYDIIHARAMEFLLLPGIKRWQVHDGVLAVWAESHFKSDEIRGVLDRLLDFLELVPEHIWASTAPAGGRA